MEQAEESLKDWVKKNAHQIIEEVCKDCESVKTKNALFMSGSPGAGKTETARRLIEEISDTSFVHIDQDVIKSLLPGYSGNNAEKYHGAASLGVEKVLDHIFKKGYNFVLDSTFSNFKKARSNVERSLKRGCRVEVFFVYQEPKSAWKFVKKREQVEGRVVPKESFARQFIGSREVVNEIKNTFEEKIKIHFVLKTVSEGNEAMQEKFEFNVQNVDDYIKKMYTKVYSDSEEILRIIS